MKRSSAFSLIELLVVISIIAVLIAMLLPTLKEARRHTMVIRCMSQLQQVGIGLGNYVVENNGKYPPPSVISPNVIRTTEAGLGSVDNRQALYEIAGMRAAELYFCPLTGHSPADNVVTTPWSHEFGACLTADRHWVDYNMFFLVSETAMSWSQLRSGHAKLRSHLLNYVYRTGNEGFYAY